MSIVFDLLPRVDPFTTLLATIGVAMVPHMIKGHFVTKVGGQYDNANPRSTTQNALKDKTYGPMISRCLACHENTLEALLFYGLAALSAFASGVDKDFISAWSGAFLLSRVAYVPAYVFVQRRRFSYLRSLIWTVTPISVIALLRAAARAY